MSTWFRSLFHPDSAGPCLEVQVYRHDTVLLCHQVTPSHTFNIGRSVLNPITIDTPSLPMQQFTLVYFHTKGPLVQFTSTMRGVLLYDKELITLDELKHKPHVHPTLHGYRFLLRPHASLILYIDQFVFRLCWALQKRPSFGPQSPLLNLLNPTYRPTGAFRNSVSLNAHHQQLPTSCL